jgi:RNase P/RNase MRP subunit p29
MAVVVMIPAMQVCFLALRAFTGTNVPLAFSHDRNLGGIRIYVANSEQRCTDHNRDTSICIPSGGISRTTCCSLHLLEKGRLVRIEGNFLQLLPEDFSSLLRICCPPAGKLAVIIGCVYGDSGAP